ncbi:hypothetical protein B0O99DRAFT_621209 [Bisporella sp. PMI_857]|nr:hypothetical protein B0O99DRAFT_621209 [Bisporella sp. PMI_857]
MTPEQDQEGFQGASLYMITAEEASLLHPNTLAESPTSSSVNCNGSDSTYSTNAYLEHPYIYSTRREWLVPMNMIPVKLDIEGLLEDHNRRKKEEGNKNLASTFRRRAQNRASQRAFRERKEKLMKELEQRFQELRDRHNDLLQSYESLQLEYSRVQESLDGLLKENEKLKKGSLLSKATGKVIEETKVAIDPLLFDISEFCFDDTRTKFI